MRFNEEVEVCACMEVVESEFGVNGEPNREMGIYQLGDAYEAGGGSTCLVNGKSMKGESMKSKSVSRGQDVL